MTASKDALEALHTAVAEALEKRLADGTATAADISAAIKFLKDNGVAMLPEDDSPVDRVVKNLPFDEHDVTAH